MQTHLSPTFQLRALAIRAAQAFTGVNMAVGRQLMAVSSALMASASEDLARRLERARAAQAAAGARAAPARAPAQASNDPSPLPEPYEFMQVLDSYSLLAPGQTMTLFFDPECDADVVHMNLPTLAGSTSSGEGFTIADIRVGHRSIWGVVRQLPGEVFSGAGLAFPRPKDGPYPLVIPQIRCGQQLRMTVRRDHDAKDAERFQLQVHLKGR